MRGRPWGTSRRLTSGRWQARYVFHGERFLAPKTFATQKAADAWLRQKRTEIERGDHIDPKLGRVLLSEYVELWKKSSAVARLRPSTKNRDFDYVRNYLLPHLGKKALEDLDFQAIDEWIVNLKEHGGRRSRPLGSETVAKACQILGKILDRAVKSGHISSNPCRLVHPPKSTKKALTIVGEIEIARLANAIDLRFRAFVYLASYAGLRAGELFGLKWSNVDLAGRRVTVSNTVVETNGQLHIDQPPKSDAGRRTVPLSGEATRALAAHAEMFGCRPDDYVFPNEVGNAMRLSNFRNRYWKPALKRAGMDPSFRIHDQRHTAISLWIKAGINVKEVSVHAGHTSVAFTLDRYGHLYPDNGDAFLRALDAATEQSLGISGHDSGHGIAPIIEINGINSVNRDNEWALRDSNPRPQPCESVSPGQMGCFYWAIDDRSRYRYRTQTTSHFTIWCLL
jgi:integrase